MRFELKKIVHISGEKNKGQFTLSPSTGILLQLKNTISLLPKIMYHVSSLFIMFTFPNLSGCHTTPKVTSIFILNGSCWFRFLRVF